MKKISLLSLIFICLILALNGIFSAAVYEDDDVSPDGIFNVKDSFWYREFFAGNLSRAEIFYEDYDGVVSLESIRSYLARHEKSPPVIPA